MGIECHAGHLEVARKWREGNWHKPTRFPYFGTRAHALVPISHIWGPVAARHAVNSTIPYSLSPALLVTCPGLSCPAPACRETDRKREGKEGCHGTPATPALIDPKALTGDLASRSRLALQVAENNPSSSQPLAYQPTSQLRHPNLPTSISHPSRSQLDDRLGLRPTQADRDLDVDLTCLCLPNPGPDLPYQPSCLLVLNFVSTEPRSNGATGDSSGVILSSVLPACSTRLFSTTPRRSIPILRALCSPSATTTLAFLHCTASLRRPLPPSPLHFDPLPPQSSIQLPLPNWLWLTEPHSILAVHSFSKLKQW